MSEQPEEDALRLALALGRLDDKAFDALYSARPRRVARRFWTPLAVAYRAAEVLARMGARLVLDVGSGAGKFCIAAAAAAPSIHFTGVEQRPHLVEEAQAVAARLSVRNVSFSVGDATCSELSDFDAIYLFNPFGENTDGDGYRFDATVELSEARFFADVLRMEQAIENAHDGLLVVTYFGFGGRLSGNYDLAHSEAIGTDWLRVWRKARDHQGHLWYFEERDEVMVTEVKERGGDPASTHFSWKGRP